MPFTINTITSEIREFEPEILGETGKISYRQSAYTPAVESAMVEAANAQMPAEAAAKILSAVLVDWDLLDEKGEKIAPTYENMLALPASFLSAVVSAVMEDISAKADRKN